MKYGIREICEVVLKAKARMKVGNKIFYKDEPVLYFDSLKTSTMEGAATTVYAQGGRGNARLIAWEGERTVTFTMEDALISKVGLAILTGADVIDATKDAPVIQHVTERVAMGADGIVYVSEKPYVGTEAEKNTAEHWIYVMALDDEGNPSTEPHIFTYGDSAANENGKYALTLATKAIDGSKDYTSDEAYKKAKAVLVDYYVARAGKACQINITPDKFGGNFYLEASTLFRDTNGTDLPAEFIIPNCKVQSNFTFSMASSGDPSTFTFTMDAFPDYTRFDKTTKVLSAIQIIEDASEDAYQRVATAADASYKAGSDRVIDEK